jgi:hypothetical protein
MIGSVERVKLLLLVLAAGASLLHGQGMVEYGASAGRSGAAAGLGGAGKSATKVFDKLNQSLGGVARADEAQKPGAAAPVAASVPASSIAPAPAAATPVAPPDFSALTTGMERADLIKKVGKPTMSMSGMESSKVIETCWYRNGAENVTVILRDGKVAEFTGLEKPAAK